MMGRGQALTRKALQRPMSTAINWGRLSKQLPRHEFDAIDGAVKQKQQIIASTPKEVPEIDWDYYKSVIKTPGLVQQAEETYNRLQAESTPSAESVEEAKNSVFDADARMVADMIHKGEDLEAAFPESKKEALSEQAQYLIACFHTQKERLKDLVYCDRVTQRLEYESANWKDMSVWEYVKDKQPLVRRCEDEVLNDDWNLEPTFAKEWTWTIRDNPWAYEAEPKKE